MKREQRIYLKIRANLHMAGADIDDSLCMMKFLQEKLDSLTEEFRIAAEARMPDTSVSIVSYPDYLDSE